MLTEWKGKEIFLRGTIYYRYRETVDMCHLHLLHPASQLCCRHLLTVHYFFFFLKALVHIGLWVL